MERASFGLIQVGGQFSLRASAGPVRWSGERSPRHGIVDRSLVSVELRNGVLTSRVVEQDSSGDVHISAGPDAGDHEHWFHRTFRPMPEPNTWSDPVIAGIAIRFNRLYAFTDGSLFTGIVTSIIGQSISLASASAVQRRLALSFSEGVDIGGRQFVPLPEAATLAEAPIEALRASGMTWKRAEALHTIAQEEIGGNLPGDSDAINDPEGTARALRELPLVGPWTAASALLWGLGAPDSYPSGDVALLRAARLAYDRPDMTMRDLDVLAETWRPHRGTVTRLLWANLLGPAWQE